MPARAGRRAELGWEGPETRVGDLKCTKQLRLIPELEFYLRLTLEQGW